MEWVTRGAYVCVNVRTDFRQQGSVKQSTERACACTSNQGATLRASGLCVTHGSVPLLGAVCACMFQGQCELCLCA